MSRRSSYEQPDEVSALNIIPDVSNPQEIIEHGAKTLLFAMTQTKYVHQKTASYATMSNASPQEKTQAIVKFLSDMAFPESWFPDVA